MKHICIFILISSLSIHSLLASDLSLNNEALTSSLSLITPDLSYQNSDNIKIPTEKLVSNQVTKLPNTTSPTSEILTKAKSYIEQLGINDISELGTIQVKDIRTNLANGLYLLSKNCSNSENEPELKSYLTLWDAHCTTISGYFNEGETNYNVVSYTGSDIIGSVIIAKKIILDTATITIPEGVNELYLIAEEIETINNNSITWEKSGTQKDKSNQASATPHSSTNSRCSDHSGEDASCTGDDGNTGENGNSGEVGDNGPNIYIVLKKIVKNNNSILQFPQFNISGMLGQDGQDGQGGGQGNTGKRGKTAVNDWYSLGCEEGAGWGGQGGNGGNGGNAGKGGKGGNGGNTYFYYLEMENIDSEESLKNSLRSHKITNSGGTGGQAGYYGSGGAQGEGGQGGDGVQNFLGMWVCDDEHETRQGPQGERPGEDGTTNSRGSNGSNGIIEVTQISEEEWNDFSSSPYINNIAPSIIYPGDNITISVINMSGTLQAKLISKKSGYERILNLIAQENNTYLLSDTYTLSIGDWELTLISENIESLNSFDLTVHVPNTAVENRDWKRPYRMGFNTIRKSDMKTVGTNLNELDTLPEVLNDISATGGQGARHFQSYDLTWFSGGVYESGTGLDDSNNFDFSGREELFANENGLYTIPTLFVVGPSSMSRYLGYEKPTTCAELYTYADDILLNNLYQSEKDKLSTTYCNNEEGVFQGITAENFWDELVEEMGIFIFEGSIRWDLYSPFCSDGSHAYYSPEGYCSTIYTPDREELNVEKNNIASGVRTYLESIADWISDTGSEVKHFEIGNELERGPSRELLNWKWQWGPERYSDLLRMTRNILREKDSDNKIIFGGSFFSDNGGKEREWLEGTLSSANETLETGEDRTLFDIHSFHYYGEWTELKSYINKFRSILDDYDHENTPMWLTEVGMSATVNGEDEQAKFLVKTFAVAFGNGIEVVNWHTHISSNDGLENWGGFGLRPASQKECNEGGCRDKYKAYYAYQLLSDKIGNFQESKILNEGEYEELGSSDGNIEYNFNSTIVSGLFAYKFTNSLYSEWGVQSNKIILWTHNTDKLTYDLTDYIYETMGESTTVS